MYAAVAIGPSAARAAEVLSSHIAPPSFHPATLHLSPFFLSFFLFPRRTHEQTEPDATTEFIEYMLLCCLPGVPAPHHDRRGSGRLGDGAVEAGHEGAGSRGHGDQHDGDDLELDHDDEDELR